MEVVSDVVLVVTEPSPAHHDHARRLVAAAAIAVATIAVVVVIAVLDWDLNFLEFQLKPAWYVEQNGDKNHGHNVEENLEN